MKKRVLTLYAQGYGCGQCLLLAAAEGYGIAINEKLPQGFVPINGGYGTGGLCAVFFAAMLLLGMLLDEQRAKACRMEFLLSMQERFGSINCAGLAYAGCENVMGTAAEVLEALLGREGFPYGA